MIKRRFLTVSAALLAVLVLAWLVLRDTSPIGHFRSAADKDRYVEAYAAAMADLPPPDETLDLRTDFGIVRAYRFAGAAPDAPPLVLLPGTTSGSPVWADNLPSLLRERSVYTLDLLGEPGLSVQDRPVENADDQARWLSQALDALPHEKIHLFGYSIGGWTAANLAVHDQDKLASLSLLDPVRVFADLSPEVVVRSIPASVHWLPRAWRDDFASWVAGGAPVEDEPVAEMIEAGQSTYSMAQPGPVLIAPDRMAALDVPVLAIMAGRSVMHDSPAAAAVARDTLPGARVELWPEASHAVNGEFPDRIAAAVAEHIRSAEQ